MRSSATYISVLVGVANVALCVMLTSGCTTRRDHTVLLKGIPTKVMALDPRNTRAPQISLRVPSHFERDWTESTNSDSFIIFDPNDNGSVQGGMLIVNVTSAVFPHIPDSLKTRHSRSSIAGETIEWRERSFVDDSGVTLHQREAVRKQLFKLFQDPKTKEELILQVFVVGADSSLVERLMGSAETIVIGGGRPDA